MYVEKDGSRSQLVIMVLSPALVWRSFVLLSLWFEGTETHLIPTWFAIVRSVLACCLASIVGSNSLLLSFDRSRSFLAVPFFSFFSSISLLTLHLPSIGRLVDNWLVHEVIQGSYREVIDGTEAIAAVHVNHEYASADPNVKETYSVDPKSSVTV